MNDRAREIHGLDPGDVMSDGELLAEIRAEIARVEGGGDVAPWSDRETWLAELRAQEATVVRWMATGRTNEERNADDAFYSARGAS